MVQGLIVSIVPYYLNYVCKHPCVVIKKKKKGRKRDSEGTSKDWEGCKTPKGKLRYFLSGAVWGTCQVRQPQEAPLSSAPVRRNRVGVPALCVAVDGHDCTEVSFCKLLQEKLQNDRGRLPFALESPGLYFANSWSVSCRQSNTEVFRLRTLPSTMALEHFLKFFCFL